MKSDKYNKIFKYNKEWVEGKVRSDKDFFEKLNEEQNPDFLYIGCSDSRVPANTITGLDIGDLFVHRNIANLVSNNDLNIMSIIQYAVEVLQVKHIVVCGHYGCGGIEAALQHKSHGLLDNWLRNIRDVYRLHYNEIENLPDQDKKLRRLTELNVIEQCINVIKTSCVQKAYLKNGYPTVHGWIYDMKNGELIDMNINFKETLRKVQLVYNLK